MIVVIADDITGAAEIGGVALRYGLNVFVSDDVNTLRQPDVLVIYTDTRSMKKEEAVDVMKMLTTKVKQLRPELFYKKTDSVLRGHVLAEMKVQMEAMDLEKALLVPVNPSLGRIIRDGNYYLNGELIHQTGFFHDPEFPIKSSGIMEMLDNEDMPVKLMSKKEPLLANGISVGEAVSIEDVAAWADYGDESVLLAGGASFFNALLAKRYQAGSESREVQLSLPLLLISGTVFQKNVQQIKAFLPLVSYMPESIFLNDDPRESDYEEWLEDIARILSSHKKAIIAINHTSNKKSDPSLLREKKAWIAKLILAKMKIEELLIEGGATAYSIIKKINYRSFIPTEELQPGVVRMRVEGTEDLHLTIKPGSYHWPAEWNFN